MKFTSWFFAVAAVVALPAFADVTWFSNRDVVADFENFMGLSGDNTYVYFGKTKEGQKCQFSAVKHGKKLYFTPTTIRVKPVSGSYKNEFLASSAWFHVGELNKDVNGGFEGNKLWSSYFIDMKSSGMFEYPHGQFGVSFHLELEKNDAGKLTRIAYSKTKVMDLGYEPLGRLECLLNQ